MKVEKEILANGTARMNGVRRSEDGVAGSEVGRGLRRGTMENRVRRRVRPIASGRERRSSSARVGRRGRRLAKGVRVWSVSGVSGRVGDGYWGWAGVKGSGDEGRRGRSDEGFRCKDVEPVVG